MATAVDLIKATAHKIRILALGEPLSNDKAIGFLDELNRMLGSWANENLLIHEQKEETLTLVVDQTSYTIGESASYDFNTVRPQEILDGTFVKTSGGTTDYPLTVKTLQEYRNIANKSSSTRPWWIAYNPTYPYGTIYLFWTPDVAYELHLLSLKELSSFATLTTDVSLPPGYEDAIVYNLAVRMGPDFGKTLRQDILLLAEQGLKVIKRRNARRLAPTRLDVGRFTNRKLGWGDITTGPYV